MIESLLAHFYHELLGDSITTQKALDSSSVHIFVSSDDVCYVIFVPCPSPRFLNAFGRVVPLEQHLKVLITTNYFFCKGLNFDRCFVFFDHMELSFKYYEQLFFLKAFYETFIHADAIIFVVMGKKCSLVDIILYFCQFTFAFQFSLHLALTQVVLDTRCRP